MTSSFLAAEYVGICYTEINWAIHQDLVIRADISCIFDLE